tara:strand:- start:7987 stop:8745 length:759 start_codon:yes stop_codon:yes gene_type:complete
MEKKFWQSEWHNIQFKDLDARTSMFKHASAEFYEKFYQEFFKRHQSYSDLDPHHRAIKAATGKEILDYIHKGDEVLSYGFGSGYVESEMLKIRQDFALECFERSSTMSSWLAALHPSIRLHFQLDSLKTYDLIYLVQITYAMSKVDIDRTFSGLINNLAPGGRLLLIDTSFLPKENNNQYQDKKFKYLLNKVKGWLRPIYYFIFKSDGQQLWGWQRDNACLINYLEELGLSLQSVEAKDQQSYKVFKRTSDL